MHDSIFNGDVMDFSYTKPGYPFLPGEGNDSPRSSRYGRTMSPISPAAGNSPRVADRRTMTPSSTTYQQQQQLPYSNYDQQTQQRHQSQQPSLYLFGQQQQQQHHQRQPSQHTAYNLPPAFSPQQHHQHATVGRFQDELSYTGTLSTSDVHSNFVNPGSDQMDFMPQSNSSDIVAFPAQTDLQGVFSKETGPIDKPGILLTPDVPSQHPFGSNCPLIRFLDAYQQSYPGLRAEVQAIVQRAAQQDISEHYQQWQAENPSTPSLNSSASTAPSQDTGYLCPNAGSSEPGPNHSEIGCTFPCPTCPKSFRKKDDLRKHMQARNPPEKWHCGAQGCNTDFGRLDKYRDHLKTKHKQTPSSGELKKLAIACPQSFPERCLQCSDRPATWTEWFDHHLAHHRGDARSAPHTPRPHGSPNTAFTSAKSELVGTTHLPPIQRYVSEQERSEGIRVGVPYMSQNVDTSLRSFDRLFPPQQGYYPGGYS
jgi:hypothetical protein